MQALWKLVIPIQPEEGEWQSLPNTGWYYRVTCARNSSTCQSSAPEAQCEQLDIHNLYGRTCSVFNKQPKELPVLIWTGIYQPSPSPVTPSDLTLCINPASTLGRALCFYTLLFRGAVKSFWDGIFLCKDKLNQPHKSSITATALMKFAQALWNRTKWIIDSKQNKHATEYLIGK